MAKHVFYRACFIITLVCLLPVPALPQLYAVHAVSFGSTGIDAAQHLAEAPAGTYYGSGIFSGHIFFGTHSLTSSGYSDIFAARLDTLGSVLWVVSFGSDAVESVTEMKSDDEGNLYLTGTFSGTLRAGDLQITSSGGNDFYAVKISPEGTFLWAVQGGGAGDDGGTGLAVSQNTIFLTGYVSAGAVFGELPIPNAGGTDGFYASLSKDGAVLSAASFGGQFNDYGKVAAVNEAGDLFLSGIYRDAMSIGGTTVTPFYGTMGIFIAKFSGTSLSYCSQIDYAQETQGTYPVGIEVIHDTVYLAGNFSNVLYTGLDSYRPVGASDIFFASFDPSGAVIFLRALSGSGSDILYGFDYTQTGYFLFGGKVNGTFSYDGITLEAESESIFLAGLHTDRTAKFAMLYPGTGVSFCSDILLGEGGKTIFAGGFTDSLELNSTLLSSNGSADMFFSAADFRLSPLQFNPPPGWDHTPKLVRIISRDEPVEIHYTLDGSTPNRNSPLDTGTVAVNFTSTLKAIAYQEGSIPSPIARAAYIVDPPCGTIYFDVPEDLIDSDRDGFATISLSPIYHLSYGYYAHVYWYVDSTLVDTVRNPVITIPSGHHYITVKAVTNYGNTCIDARSTTVYIKKVMYQTPLSAQMSFLSSSLFICPGTDGSIACYDTTARLRWSMSLGSEPFSSACVWGNSFYITASNPLRLLKINDYGTIQWEFPLYGTQMTNPVLLNESSLLIVVRDTILTALDTSGTVLWEKVVPKGFVGDPMVLGNGNIVILPNTQIQILQPDGTTVFSATLPVSRRSFLAVYDQSHFLLLTSSTMYLFAFNGNLIRTKATPLYLDPSSLLIDKRGNIYISHSAGVHSYSNNFALRWHLPGAGFRNNAPILSPSDYYYLPFEQGIHVFDEAGAFVWDMSYIEEVRVAPIILPSGLIFFGTVDGHMYLMRDPETVRYPDAPYRWHTSLGNIQRTGNIGLFTDIPPDDTVDALPKSFLFRQNYPNPFNPATTLSFSLKEESKVTLTVFDILGREVNRAAEEIFAAGEHKLLFDGSNLPSGIYFANLYARGTLSGALSRSVIKMMLIK